MAKAFVSRLPQTAVERAVQGGYGTGSVRGIGGLGALEEEFRANPEAYCAQVKASKDKVVKSWRRWVREEMPLKLPARQDVGLAAWILASALDEKEKGHDALAWARLYSFMEALGQVVVDNGD